MLDERNFVSTTRLSKGLRCRLYSQRNRKSRILLQVRLLVSRRAYQKSDFVVRTKAVNFDSKLGVRCLGNIPLRYLRQRVL